MRKSASCADEIGAPAYLKHPIAQTERALESRVFKDIRAEGGNPADLFFACSQSRPWCRR